METRCRCGNPILYPFYQLGCLECGAACCPACAVSLESAPYCARCAGSILGVGSLLQSLYPDQILVG